MSGIVSKIFIATVAILMLMGDAESLNCFQNDSLNGPNINPINRFMSAPCPSGGAEPMQCLRVESTLHALVISQSGKDKWVYGKCVNASSCLNIDCKNYTKELSNSNPFTRMMSCRANCCATDNCNNVTIAEQTGIADAAVPTNPPAPPNPAQQFGFGGLFPPGLGPPRGVIPGFFFSTRRTPAKPPTKPPTNPSGNISTSLSGNQSVPNASSAVTSSAVASSTVVVMATAKTSGGSITNSGVGVVTQGSTNPSPSTPGGVMSPQSGFSSTNGGSMSMTTSMPQSSDLSSTSGLGLMTTTSGGSVNHYNLLLFMLSVFGLLSFPLV